jgi:hypothetical protein
MEFITTKDGFILKQNGLEQIYNWTEYDSQFELKPCAFIYEYDRPYIIKDKDYNAENDLEHFANHYLQHNNLITNTWTSESFPGAGEEYSNFVFNDDKWIIQHNSGTSVCTGIFWKLIFNNPSDEVKRKIMTMILEGSKLWHDYE